MNGSRSLVGNKLYEVSSFDPMIGLCSCLGSACLCTPPHTLIVGTMPSITSHGHRMYYSHPSNAFWWIAGDALGWRRGGPRIDQIWPHQWDKTPAKDILAGLHHPEAPILSYSEQVSSLTKAGFALWDIVKSCTIRNSDDTSIKDCQPNDISGLLVEYPSINKIVFASGKTSAMEFVKMHRAWLRQPACFTVGSTEFSHSVFDKVVTIPAQLGQGVELMVPHSVSPAAASIRYEGKRDQWLKMVFSTNNNKGNFSTVGQIKTASSITDFYKIRKSNAVYSNNGSTIKSDEEPEIKGNMEEIDKLST